MWISLLKISTYIERKKFIWNERILKTWAYKLKIKWKQKKKFYGSTSTTSSNRRPNLGHIACVCENNFRIFFHVCLGFSFSFHFFFFVSKVNYNWLYFNIVYNESSFMIIRKRGRNPALNWNNLNYFFFSLFVFQGPRKNQSMTTTGLRRNWKLIQWKKTRTRTCTHTQIAIIIWCMKCCRKFQSNFECVFSLVSVFLPFWRDTWFLHPSFSLFFIIETMRKVSGKRNFYFFFYPGILCDPSEINE